jgi:acetyltransferase-like isoleucine patch superfamily enzyme
VERGQARRIARRFLDLARREAGLAGVTDPATGQLTGSLSAREAIAAGRATVGPHTYGHFTVEAGHGDRAGVRIGDYCSIARDVKFLVGGNHRVEWVSSYPFRTVWDLPGALSDGHPRPERDIVVGNDVWIAHEAMIMPGVTIGDGAVVAARAVVAADVRPYAIVGGIPAREIRRRFSDEVVEALLEVRWWEWPEERVRAHVDLLSSGEVEAFLAAAGSVVTSR